MMDLSEVDNNTSNMNSMRMDMNEDDDEFIVHDNGNMGAEDEEDIMKKLSARLRTAIRSDNAIGKRQQTRKNYRSKEMLLNEAIDSLRNSIKSKELIIKYMDENTRYKDEALKEMEKNLKAKDELIKAKDEEIAKIKSTPQLCCRCQIEENKQTATKPSWLYGLLSNFYTQSPTTSS